MIALGRPGVLLLVAALFAAPPASAQSAAERYASACAACHGKEGQSALLETPSLGGQPAFFVVAQLFLFREGRRDPSPMTEIAKGMTNDDLRAYAEVVAQLPAPKPPGTPADVARLERGRKPLERGRCGSCHNADFSGVRNVPRLAHQREDYLLKTLREYKSGKRVGYGTAVMTEVVADMSDADLQDVAHHLAHFPVHR